MEIYCSVCGNSFILTKGISNDLVYIMAKRAIEIRWDSAKVGGTFHSCFKNSCYNKIPTIEKDRGDFIIRGVFTSDYIKGATRPVSRVLS